MPTEVSEEVTTTDVQEYIADLVDKGIKPVIVLSRYNAAHSRFESEFGPRENYPTSKIDKYVLGCLRELDPSRN